MLLDVHDVSVYHAARVLDCRLIDRRTRERCGAITVEDAKCGSITTTDTTTSILLCVVPGTVVLHQPSPLDPPLHRALTPLVSRNVGIPELIALLNKLGSNLVGSEPWSFLVQLILLLLVLVLPLPLLAPDWARVSGYLTREDMVA